MATEARTPMERTQHGWWIPEEMPVEGISLFPSPLVAKEMHEAEAVMRAAPLECGMDHADEQEQVSVEENTMVVKVGQGNELGVHDSSLPEAMLVISRSTVCALSCARFFGQGCSNQLGSA